MKALQSKPFEDAALSPFLLIALYSIRVRLTPNGQAHYYIDIDGPARMTRLRIFASYPRLLQRLARRCVAFRASNRAPLPS